MRHIVVAAVIAIGIAGCATSPIPTEDAQPVPSERVFRNNQLPSEGAAWTVFVRDVGLNQAGAYLHLFINGKKAASLNPGEKVEFVLPPGEYIFGVKPTDPFGGYTLNTIDQELKPGKRYFYRIATDGNFRSFVQRFLPESE